MTLKIIIVDDEESIRDTFRWYLEDLGHEVSTFAEPLECDIKTHCSCQKSTACCDALLIDYHMPTMNGLDFIEGQMKGGCKGDPRNILLMSGDTTRIDMNKVAAIGCRIEQKPLSLDTLETWIDEVWLRRGKRDLPD